MAEFAEWESFYVILGGGAAALIGLQFVVLTLIADNPQVASPEAGAAFGTPTIVHFATALRLALIVRVPWYTITPAALLWGLVGLGGAFYAVLVARRMVAQRAYKPDAEDWLFHFVLPMVAYATLALSALAASSYTGEALFGVGAAT